MLDVSIFASTVAFACAVDDLWLKAFLVILAGTMISTLFVLAHDATHGSLVRSRRHNAILGRVLLLPSLHNYALWKIQHNRLHHQSPNVKGVNSWSPLSAAEFRALPRWKQLRERIYRGGGYGIYYLFERWWKFKLYPSRDIDGAMRSRALLDFAAVAGSCGVWCAFSGLVGAAYGQPWWSSILCGVILPFFVWNSLMGLTVYLQHTHHMVPWFRTMGEAQSFGHEEVTVNVKYPRWYGILSHEIMEHPAHHINPLIPFYRLRAAQEHLNAVLGEDAIVEKMGPRYLLRLMSRCKLYDYDRREWTDYSGETTGLTQTPFMSPEAPRA